MSRRTAINLMLLAALLAVAGWWIYAGPPAEAPKPPAAPVGTVAAVATTPPTGTLPETASGSAASTPVGAASSASPFEPVAVGAAGAVRAGVPDDSIETSPSAAAGTSVAPASPAATPVPSLSAPKRGISEVLEGVDLSIPGERERVVAELKAIEEADKQAAVVRARELGLPLRRETPDGRVEEIAGLDENGRLLYRTTHNVNAAISTAANLVQAAPYNLTGTNIIAGVWDEGSARATHQELSGRVTAKDGAAGRDHSTHVAGTIAARGVDANAKGMATAARIDSYDWNSDISELTSAGAATAAETNRVLVSNHSYGYIAGWWQINGGSPYRQWEWWGSGTNTAGVEDDFGRYTSITRSTDLVTVALPFMTIFWSAGNERNNNPSEGSSVALSAGSATVVSYSSASHPPGDGTYRGGYENISFNSVAKNIVVVGAVNDAVSGGVRATSNATMSSFSSWGPADDGRIKPDVVANGVGVYSSTAGNDAAYGTYNGTSMASPNAAGSAVLIAQEHVRLFGQAMRSSTLRGLLIHTADDLGRAGPDYLNGWGLINTKAAVDLVRDHAANPSRARLTEGLITTASNTITHAFTWDGVSPIKATLAWTDPAGSVMSAHDARTANLVNNLDLRVVGPTGTTNRPYVMPFVGTWTQASMSQAAATGTNNTDNVEQVFIAAPAAAGIYQAVVTFQGALSGNQQNYSLLISGSAAVPRILAAASTSSGETEADGAVTYQVVRGASTTVSVSAQDDGGEGSLTYTWSATGGAVGFTPNGTNAAKSPTATFPAAGDYTLTVTVRNAGGFTATSAVPVRVKQTPSSVEVAPSSATVAYGATQQFTAERRDQFGAAMAVQPTFAWSVSGGGTISGGGLFTAGLAGGPHTVTAEAGGISGTAQVSVTKAAATVTLGELSATYDGAAKAVSVTTDPPGLAVAVTYNGTSNAPVDPGSYDVIATVTDVNHAGSASGTLVIEGILPTFEPWIGGFAGLSDVTPAGDPDGDGLSNAMEYFMGLDPTVNDAAAAFAQGADLDGVFLDYRRSKATHGITGAVEWSTNPGANAVWSGASVGDVLLQDHGAWELRRASVPWLAPDAPIFLRLDLMME